MHFILISKWNQFFIVHSGMNIKIVTGGRKSGSGTQNQIGSDHNDQ